jgi:toxin YoeB
MYEIILSKNALEDIHLLIKSGNVAVIKKLHQLLGELKTNPFTGTGKPKSLGHDRAGQWSRRISGKHRLVYTVDQDIVTVYVLSAAAHYDDK